MMLFKSLVASSLLVAASSAFAVNPTFRSVERAVDAVELDALRVRSSTCVSNIDLEKTIAAQYRFGDDAWSEVTVEKGISVIFTETHSNNTEPSKLTIKFLNKEGADAQEMTYDLAQTETRLTPRSCNGIENYRFQKTDAPELTIDLVHVTP